MICRSTDGAGADRYSLYEFLQIPNQVLFQNFYQPKLPNDIGMFRCWKNALNQTKVDLKLNEKVTRLVKIGSNKFQGILTDKNRYEAKQIIIAIPPKFILELITLSGISDAFGKSEKFSKWVEKTNYSNNLSICFHWNTKIKINNQLEFYDSLWGVKIVILSDFMDFKDNRSKTVISTEIVKLDVISPNLNKTANQSSLDEITKEVFNQLKDIFPILTRNYLAVVTPGTRKENNKWTSKDTAYIAASNMPTIEFQSLKYPNLWNLGTHNGKAQDVAFTCFESAVTNSLFLAHILQPLSKKYYKIQSRPITLVKIIWILILVIALLIFFFHLNKKKVYYIDK